MDCSWQVASGIKMLSSVVSPHQLKRSYQVNLRFWGCGYFFSFQNYVKLRSTSREIFWLICTRNWSRLQPLIVTAPRQDYINFKKDLKQKQKGGSGRVYQRQKYFNITGGVGRVRQSNSKPSLAGLAEAEGKGFAVCNEELLHTSVSSPTHSPVLPGHLPYCMSLPTSCSSDCWGRDLQSFVTVHSDLVRFGQEQAPMCFCWLCLARNPQGLLGCFHLVACSSVERRMG